jgi:hypothetical protein
MNTATSAAAPPRSYTAAGLTGTAPRSSKYTSWRICAWAGPVFLIGYICSWGLLGFNVPPLDPGISINDLHTHYVDNSVRIRLAMTLSLFFGPFYFVFSALLSRVLQKVEGPDGPLSLIEQMGGLLTTVVLLVGGVSWLTAAFRVDERTPELIRQLHDFGWMFFDTTYMCTSLQMLGVAGVILSDKRSQPLLPRWMAWFSLFVAIVFVPLTLMPFFLKGPFAWNGVFNYWFGFSAFFWWVLFMCIQLFKAIGRLEQEAAATA